MKLGWATGRVLANNGDGPVLIGKDTRVSGYMFESALEAGLSAAGVDIHLLGPMPTPGIAYLTRHSSSQAAIVISASHNPFHDNGIKFFSGNGMKLPDEVELAIEAELEKPFKVNNPNILGKAHRMDDAPRRYIDFCKSKIGNGINFADLLVVVDCAHGATYQIAPTVLRELGAEVCAIGIEPDGYNINKHRGATAPQALRKKVIALQADAGIALDGDGDRLIMVDHTGNIVDGDEILFIISAAQCQSLNGGTVGTVMSNLGLEQATKALGLNFIRAQVGDRYVMETLQKNRLILGGEPSGHIINRNKTTTGDGIISALQILKIIVHSGKTLHELKSGMHKYPQAMVNVALDQDVNLTTGNLREAKKSAEEELGNNGRVLLRRSGTEPLVRIMVEGDTEKQVNKLAQDLADEIKTAHGLSNG